MRLNKNYSFSYGQGEQQTKLDFIKTTTKIFKGENIGNAFRFYIDGVCVHECNNETDSDAIMYPAIQSGSWCETKTYIVTFY